MANDILQETKKFFENIKSIYKETGYEKSYPLNYFWGGSNIGKLQEIIYRDDSAEEKINAVQNTDMFSVNTPNTDLKNRMVDWYVDYLHGLNDLDFSIQESFVSNPQNCVMRGCGRMLSPDFLRTVALSLEIQKYCQFSCDNFNVIELGAGYGGLARTMKLFFPHVSYFIVDIPEALYFSSLFLRLNFPNARAYYVTSMDAAENALDYYDFIFIPTKFVDVVLDSHFELFCNTASLGEMKNEVIRYWMDFVQNKLDIRYFFGLNRFLNTINIPSHSFRLDENVCSVSFDSDWRIIQWELEPPFSRCPYLETSVTRNLEIIAERLPKGVANSLYNQRLSRQIIANIFKHDWFVHSGQDNTMMLRDNILTHDFTKKGTLFKLWESIRLEPRVDNTVMMLTYLSSLMKDKPFEEMFYYYALFKKLETGTDIDYTDLVTIEESMSQISKIAQHPILEVA